MKQKKVPMRMCLGCHRMKPKKELIRIVKSAEGDITIDLTGKKSGRGAYMCKDTECLEKAQKGKKIEKTFEAPVQQDTYKLLSSQIGKNMVNNLESSISGGAFDGKNENS